jgi:hypothetical protein
LRELDFIKYDQSALYEQIVELTEKHQARNVNALYGVGQIVVSNFLAEVFRPERFERGKEYDNRISFDMAFQG